MVFEVDVSHLEDFEKLHLRVRLLEAVLFVRVYIFIQVASVLRNYMVSESACMLR